MLSLLITLVCIGFILWLINAHVPMAPAVKNVLNIAVAIFAVLLTLQAFGILPNFIHSMRVR